MIFDLLAPPHDPGGGGGGGQKIVPLHVPFM